MNKNYSEVSIQHKFDFYCKKVLRNEAKNIRKQITRIREKERPFDNTIENRMEQISQKPYIDELDIYFLLGMEILVADRRLSKAIDGLSETRRRIVLLFYFAGFNNKEIGKILNMSTSGISYQRKKAIEQLRMEYDVCQKRKIKKNTR